MTILRTAMADYAARKAPIGEAEETRRGELLAQMLRLRWHTVGTDPRYQTEWGDKTALGLYRTVKRIAEEGK